MKRKIHSSVANIEEDFSRERFLFPFSLWKWIRTIETDGFNSSNGKIKIKKVNNLLFLPLVVAQ